MAAKNILNISINQFDNGAFGVTIIKKSTNVQTGITTSSRVENAYEELAEAKTFATTAVSSTAA